METISQKIIYSYQKHIRLLCIWFLTFIVAAFLDNQVSHYNAKAYHFSHPEYYAYTLGDESAGTYAQIFRVLTWILTIIAVIVYIQLVVAFVKFLKNCWETIQDDGFAMTTPQKAVGFLFVPIFNLYWIFIAYYGLSKQINKYIDRHNLDSRFKSKQGQTLAFCILLFVPFLGWIISIFLYFMVLADFKRSCTYIVDNKGKT
jgi:hypothetical protein